MSASAWAPGNLLDVDPTLRNQLADPVVANGNGAVKVAFTPNGPGAVASTVDEELRFNEVSAMHFMSAAQKADVRNNVASLDITLAVAAAVSFLKVLGGGTLRAPRGTYLYNGTAGLDTYKNGLILPDTNGDFSTNNGIYVIGEGVETVFKAGSANMIVFRNSRTYSGGEKFRIDGGGLANVIGLAVAPESLTQLTEVVSQSYCRLRNITVEHCIEGMLVQPGPSVAGSDSGCFYHDFSNMNFNLNTRAVWLKKDASGAGNRTTRTKFNGLTMTRGNTGLQIDGGTEIDIYSMNCEQLNTGITPSAVPTAFNYTDANPANIRIFGGYAESCTKALVATHPEQVIVYGFNHTSVKDASEFSMGRFQTGRLTVPKQNNVAAYINMGGEGFVGFVADPDQNGSKTLATQINGVDKHRFTASGDNIFYGSGGNITMDSTGQNIKFSGAGSNTIQSAADLTLNAAHYYLRDAVGGSGLRFDTSGTKSLFPEVTNTMSMGQSGFLFSAIWAANGAIQTSDPRTKTEIQDSPLGLDFILSLKPKAYKFIVGGNKVTTVVITPEEVDADGSVITQAVIENQVEAIPGKRVHYGFLTTDVKLAAGDTDFGGYIKTDVNDPESMEALRYDEFIAPLVKAVQELSAKLDIANQKIAALTPPAP